MLPLTSLSRAFGGLRESLAKDGRRAGTSSALRVSYAFFNWRFGIWSLPPLMMAPVISAVWPVKRRSLW
jgi:hypothetical protein